MNENEKELIKRTDDGWSEDLIDMFNDMHEEK